MKKTFLAMRSLFFQAETIDSTALPLPLCTLFLMGDFAVDRDGRFLTSMRRKGMRARQTEATRWIMSVLPYGANIYSYRVGKKELWTMNWRKVWGSISVPFLPTAHWLWFVLNCFTITERSMRHCFQNKVEQPSWYFCCERMRYWQLCEQGW